jgi:hypothetical protein
MPPIKPSMPEGGNNDGGEHEVIEKEGMTEKIIGQVSPEKLSSIVTQTLERYKGEFEKFSRVPTEVDKQNLNLILRQKHLKQMIILSVMSYFKRSSFLVPFTEEEISDIFNQPIDIGYYTENEIMIRIKIYPKAGKQISNGKNMGPGETTVAFKYIAEPNLLRVGNFKVNEVMPVFYPIQHYLSAEEIDLVQQKVLLMPQIPLPLRSDVQAAVITATCAIPFQVRENEVQYALSIGSEKFIGLLHIPLGFFDDPEAQLSVNFFIDSTKPREKGPLFFKFRKPIKT